MREDAKTFFFTYRSSELAASSSSASLSSREYQLSPVLSVLNSIDKKHDKRNKCMFQRCCLIMQKVMIYMREIIFFAPKLTSFLSASRMRVLSWPRLSLILALRRFSMIGFEDCK